ncbi:MAG: hypothetical protein ACXW2Q_03335 [Thermoanaerobaculia bacterium]
MAVRGDEVASSIDAHVRESIKRMVGEIRSSIDDVRGAVDSQLNAALQSMQADVNSLSFLPHLKKTLAELTESLAAPAPAAAGGDAKKLKRALQAVERGKSRVDVLNGLLEQCIEFGSHAALLILRGETFSGWKGAGFSAHGGNDETIKRFNAAPGLVPQLDEVLKQERVVEWDGANLATRFGVSAPARAILIPMVIKDKVSAAVYVDATGDDLSKLDRASLEILVFTTGLLVDTLAIRKKIPSPSLSSEAAAPAPPAAARPRPATASLSRPVPTPPPAPSRPAIPTIAGPRPVPTPASAPQEKTGAFSTTQIREVAAPPAARPSFNAPSAAPAARPTPVPPPPTPSTPSGDDRPSTQFVPPAGIQRGGPAPAGAGTEDAKRHDEARRFARLLVSEIKLYNETKVQAGRKTNDLYERLKEDIDRSRQMYDERIAEDVRKSSNYFYDELVRILADGNADSLGL